MFFTFLTMRITLVVLKSLTWLTTVFFGRVLLDPNLYDIFYCGPVDSL